VDRDVEQRDSICRGFAEELGRFRTQAGKPTHKKLEELSKERPDLRILSHSTVNDVLHGKYTQIPEWEWVYSFVTICRAYAEQYHAGPDQLDDAEEWHRRWYVAMRSCRDTAPWPVTDSDGSRSECPDPDGSARRAVLALVHHGRALGWWQEFGDLVPHWFRTYLSLEPASDLIRVCETGVVPDLLQTDDYAWSVLRLAHPDATADELDRRVELRRRRRRILHRPHPVTLSAIIDEQALRNPRVPAATMRAQLEHLIEVGERPGITVGITPAGQVAADGPITILRFPQRELPDVVYLEQLTRGRYPARPEDVHRYGQVLDRLGVETAKGDPTSTILHRIRADT
jgi:hypothetical protein